MIDKNVRVNNEFYVCPVYNEAISDKKRITIGEVEKMWGIGTPEDLENFLSENKDLEMGLISKIFKKLKNFFIKS